MMSLNDGLLCIAMIMFILCSMVWLTINILKGMTKLVKEIVQIELEGKDNKSD
jgi:hypothetical protein